MTPSGQGVPPSNLTFTLDPAEPLDLTGEYQLTLTVADTCGSVPQVAWRRTYDASVARLASATSFTIRLTGASFFGNHGTVLARTAVDFVRIPLYRPVDLLDEAELVELIGDGYVSIWGSGSTETTRADRVIAAAFAGTIAYCPQPAPASSEPTCTVPEFQCTSTSHRLTLSRE